IPKSPTNKHKIKAIHWVFEAGKSSPLLLSEVITVFVPFGYSIINTSDVFLEKIGPSKLLHSLYFISAVPTSTIFAFIFCPFFKTIISPQSAEAGKALTYDFFVK